MPSGGCPVCHRNIRSGSVCDLCLTVERLLRLVRDPSRPLSTEGFVLDRLRSVYGELLDYIERYGRETLGLAPVPKPAAAPATPSLPVAPGVEVDSTPVVSGVGETLPEVGGETGTPEGRGVRGGGDRAPEEEPEKRRKRRRKSPKSDKEKRTSPIAHRDRDHSAHREKDRHRKDKHRDKSPTKVKQERAASPPARRDPERSPLTRTRTRRDSRSPPNRGGRATSSGRRPLPPREIPRSPEQAPLSPLSEEGSEEEHRTDDEEVREAPPRYKGFKGQGWGWRDYQEELHRRNGRPRDRPPGQHKKKKAKKNKGVKKKERRREWLKERRG